MLATLKKKGCARYDMRYTVLRAFIWSDKYYIFFSVSFHFWVFGKFMTMINIVEIELISATEY